LNRYNGKLNRYNAPQESETEMTMMSLDAPPSRGLLSATEPVRVDRPARVTRSDLRLLAIVATGSPLNVVAERVGVSDRTVRRHIRRICDVLDVSTPIEAVAWAARRRLI
jgi:DNA-binding NarL/FixJ family response regulator